MIPLYGFLEGDTLGLLILAQPEDSPAALAARLVQAASVRVAAPDKVRVMFRGRALAPDETVASAGIGPLERFDVMDAG